MSSSEWSQVCISVLTDLVVKMCYSSTFTDSAALYKLSHVVVGIHLSLMLWGLMLATRLWEKKTHIYHTSVQMCHVLWQIKKTCAVYLHFLRPVSHLSCRQHLPVRCLLCRPRQWTYSSNTLCSAFDGSKAVATAGQDDSPSWVLILFYLIIYWLQRRHSKEQAKS